MQISVIIPVFNAANYVKKAILSALAQAEVEEVIVIVDGFLDNSLEICQKMASKHNRIKVLTHPNNENLGVSASRNLGITHATGEYISFLDADDYFLPNRFKDVAKKFQEDPTLLGIYTGHQIVVTNNMVYDTTPRIQSQIEPNRLFEFLVSGQEYFYIIDLVINKTKLPEDLRFDEGIHFTEDTDFIWNLCLLGKIEPCELSKPVLTRVIHDNNTIHNIDKERKGKYLFSKKWVNRITLANWSKATNRRLILNLLEGKYGHIQNKPIRLLLKSFALFSIIARKPTLIAKII